MAPALVLSVLLVAYNAAVNLLPVPRWTYVPLNLALAGALLVYARRRGLTWGSLGLDPDALASGLRWGLGVAVVVAVAVAVGLALGDRVAALQRLLADERAAGVGGVGLLYETLVRIPLGTAVVEEVAFRGVLLALIAEQRGLAAGVVVSSVAFGLWHVGPGLATLRLNAPELGALAQLLGVAVMVVVTAVAGVALCWLRLASGSLLAPVLVHWAANASGLAGAVASRR